MGPVDTGVKLLPLLDAGAELLPWEPLLDTGVELLAALPAEVGVELLGVELLGVDALIFLETGVELLAWVGPAVALGGVKPLGGVLRVRDADLYFGGSVDGFVSLAALGLLGVVSEVVA